jgi:hypothetical protein
MSREILGRFDEHGIGIASATYEITGLPTLHLLPETAGQRDSTG